MAALKDQLHADLVTAMKAGDDVAKRTLRMALAAIGTEEVAGRSPRELTDDDVLAVLRREGKKRREAATAFSDAGRPELAERESAEGHVIARYLPAQLDDAELQGIVADAVAATGADGMAAMGAVMKVAQRVVAGRADGARVAAEVRRVLGAC